MSRIKTGMGEKFQSLVFSRTKEITHTCGWDGLNSNSFLDSQSDKNSKKFGHFNYHMDSLGFSLFLKCTIPIDYAWISGSKNVSNIAKSKN